MQDYKHSILVHKNHAVSNVASNRAEEGIAVLVKVN